MHVFDSLKLLVSRGESHSVAADEGCSRCGLQQMRVAADEGCSRYGLQQMRVAADEGCSR